MDTNGMPKTSYFGKECGKLCLASNSMVQWTVNLSEVCVTWRFLRPVIAVVDRVLHWTDTGLYIVTAVVNDVQQNCDQWAFSL